MSNSLDPDQARQNVRPNLGPNYLQRLSAETTLVIKELRRKMQTFALTYLIGLTGKELQKWVLLETKDHWFSYTHGIKDEKNKTNFVQ